MASDFRVQLIHLAGFESRHAVFRIPPQTFPVLAAATPEDVQLELVDESVAPIDFDADVDLVGISVILPFAPKAYEVARRFRERGVAVVLGGHHVTALPEEAARHADAIVVGEGDLVWPQLLADFRRGELAPRYDGGTVSDLGALPPPRTDLIDPRHYSIANSVVASRGCPYNCAYCCIRTTAGRYRKRPIEDVVRDMAAAQGNVLQRKMFIFWDDNLTGDREYAKALFRAIAPLGKRWIAEATLHDFTADAELVELAAASGCRGLFCGIESFNQEALRGVRKGFNKVARFRESIQLLHDHGICVDAGMMIGFDEDDESIFDRTLETAIALDIDIMNLVLVTPYPATKLFAEMAAAGRLLHRDWSRFDGHHVVFRPARMSPDTLEAGWHRVRSEFYRMGSIARRVWRSGAAPWIVLPHNLSTRRFVQMESRRFADEAFEYSTVVREIRGSGPIPAFDGGAFEGGGFDGLGQARREAS